jgi:hypothetical protein
MLKEMLKVVVPPPPGIFFFGRVGGYFAGDICDGDGDGCMGVDGCVASVSGWM